MITPGLAAGAVRGFVRGTRAGATAISAAAVTVMTVGGVALISDHAWLVDQRDVLKSAADSAAIAATLEMTRLAGQSRTDEELQAALEPVAKRYVLLNLEHLPTERYTKAKESLEVALDIDRGANSVDVTARADLGGTLFSHHLALAGNYAGPDRMVAKTATECSGGTIEVVLALDVTASMNAKIDGNGPDTPGNRRLPVAIEAAKTLVEKLHTGCDDTDVVIGVVPWDKTVRVPSPATWSTEGWVDTGAFAAAAGDAGYEAWESGGCLADRRHGAAPAVTDGLSLRLPAAAPFPAFMYPNTEHFDPTIIAAVRRTILTSFPTYRNQPGVDADSVDRLLREHGDNTWRMPDRGPNFNCTRSAMLPLSSDRAEVEAVLDSLDDVSLMGGVTMSHLGLTWGRRMLAATWRDVWGEVGGDGTHPYEPAEDVTKALVLLTDGQNGAFSDGWSELPGRLSARYDPAGRRLEFGCNSRQVTGCRILRGQHTWRDGYASRYTAVGRFGEGREEDGFPRRGRDFSWSSTGGDARRRLARLMGDACELAHDEGLDVWTVSLLPRGQSIDEGWRSQLVACSGNAGTITDAEREAYHLQGDDRDSLEAAFQRIGEHLVTVRRTS